MPFKDPEVRKAYDRARASDPKRVAANVAYKRKRYAEDPEYREKVKAASRETPREVWRAHKVVKRALDRGEIVKPLLCEECDQGGELEAAHSDYSKPLLIRWLCRSCHRKSDVRNPKSAALR